MVVVSSAASPVETGAAATAAVADGQGEEDVSRGESGLMNSVTFNNGLWTPSAS
jgi:hypothetical protein